MSASTKLSTSIKALCYLARHPEEACSSAEIARGIGVNSSKLRHLMSMLVKNGILVVTRGKNGGFRLGRPAREIHMQEVYCAIEDRKAFHLHVHPVRGRQLPDSQKLNNYFLDLFAEVQVEIEDKMRKITIQSIVDSVFI